MRNRWKPKFTEVSGVPIEPVDRVDFMSGDIPPLPPVRGVKKPSEEKPVKRRFIGLHLKRSVGGSMISGVGVDRDDTVRPF